MVSVQMLHIFDFPGLIRISLIQHNCTEMYPDVSMSLSHVRISADCKLHVEDFCYGSLLGHKVGVPKVTPVCEPSFSPVHVWVRRFNRTYDLRRVSNLSYLLR